MNSRAPLELRLRPHGLPGRLVVFSGTDGSGKSTLAHLASEATLELGHRVVQIDILDDAVRQSRAFVEYAFDPIGSAESVDLLALSLLCAGSRLQNVRNLVIPELAAGSWVICDRYIYTTWAEFVCHSNTAAERDILRDVLSVFPRPDLGVLPYASAQTCIRRVWERADERDKPLDLAHRERLVSTYRAVARDNRLREVCTDFDSPDKSLKTLVDWVRELAGEPGGEVGSVDLEATC